MVLAVGPFSFKCFSEYVDKLMMPNRHKLITGVAIAAELGDLSLNNRVKRVIQDDANEDNQADQVVLQKGFEAARRLAIAGQPEMPGHHGGRRCD